MCVVMVYSALATGISTGLSGMQQACASQGLTASWCAVISSPFEVFCFREPLINADFACNNGASHVRKRQVAKFDSKLAFFYEGGDVYNKARD